MKTCNWTFPRNTPQKNQKRNGERIGLKPTLEQMRNAVQALPWSCVVQHREDYSPQSVMLKELASTAVRKADTLSRWQKNRSSQGDEDKNCSPLFPGQAKSGTCYEQEKTLGRARLARNSWKGPGCCSRFIIRRPEQIPRMEEHVYWECQNEKRWLNTKWRKRLGVDKSFDNNAMNLWVGNYLCGRNRVCWSAEFFISSCSIFTLLW